MPIKRNVYNPLRREQIAEYSDRTQQRVAKAQRLEGYNTVQEALDAVKQRTQTLNAQRELRYTVADGVAVFREYWAKLTREVGNELSAPLSPTKHVPAIKRCYVHPLRESGVSVSSFLTWLFENWSLCRHSRAFQKFSHYPEFPAIGWVIKYNELYLRLFRDSLAGIPVEDEPVAKPAKPVEDKATIRRIVQSAQQVISAKDRELAQLRAENKRLQTKKLRRINRFTASNGPAIPDWE